jgi:2-methylcitrate dehydratase PrpD
VAATTLRFGTVTLADFTPARLADPVTLALAAKVTMAEDGNEDPNAVVPQTVEVVQATTARVTVVHTLGSPANPLTPQAREEKAAACVAAARHRRGEAASLIAAVAALDDAPDLAGLMRAV